MSAQVVCECGLRCEELCVGLLYPEKVNAAVHRCTRTTRVTESGLSFVEGCGRQYVLAPRPAK